jgi:hypothetical protein
MKTFVLALATVQTLTAAALVFYSTSGQITAKNITLKSSHGSLLVRPAGVIIKQMQ